MIRIHQRDFRTWLQKNQGKIVGDASDVRGCPLCKFLKSKGAKHTNMQITCRTIDGERHDNSRWLREFQSNAMRLQKDLEVDGLRGHEALAALDPI